MKSLQSYNLSNGYQIFRSSNLIFNLYIENSNRPRTLIHSIISLQMKDDNRMKNTDYSLHILIDRLTVFRIIESVIVVLRKMSNISVMSWREQVTFWWDDDARFVRDQHAELDFYGTSSLKKQSVGRHVAQLGHIILIPSQPVFLNLLIAACLVEKQHIPIL